MEHLYHYTNLETLKLIFQNHTFRMTSLNYMDDLEEGETEDLQKLGRYIYISSWTKKYEESLTLWNYAENNGKTDGIRIGMKKNIFKTETINRNVMLHGQYTEIRDLEFNIGILNKMLTSNVSFVPPHATLNEVIYTNDERLLKPFVHQKHSNGFALLTGQLGIYKRHEWREQQEIRYMLRSLPLTVKEMNIDFLNTPEGEKRLLEKIKMREDIRFVDLLLKDDVFEDMEVLCGPRMSEKKKEELYELLLKYAPNAVVATSRLRIRS